MRKARPGNPTIGWLAKDIFLDSQTECQDRSPRAKESAL